MQQGRSPWTIRSYLYDTAYYFRWCLRSKVDPYLATSGDVAQFCQDYRLHAGQLSLLKRYASIKAFYHCLVANGQREENPAMAVKVKIPPREMKEPFTDDDLRAILCAARSLRDRAIILFLIATGVRLQELMKMRLEHIDWEKGMVLIEGKGMRRRFLVPGNRAMAALKDYVAERAGRIWCDIRGSPLSAQGIYLALRRVGARAGVRKVFPYRFRTTFAVRFDAATKGDIQSLQIILGHTKVESSLHYSRWGAQERALDRQREIGLADSL